MGGEPSRPPTWRGCLCPNDPGPARGKGTGGPWIFRGVQPEPRVSTQCLRMWLPARRSTRVLFSCCDPSAQLLPNLTSKFERDREPSATRAGLRTAHTLRTAGVRGPCVASPRPSAETAFSDGRGAALLIFVCAWKRVSVREGEWNGFGVFGGGQGPVRWIVRR